jgi:hypothetical protein
VALSLSDCVGTPIPALVTPASLSVEYTDPSFVGLNEATLRLARFEGTQWVPVVGQQPNVAINEILASETRPGIYSVVGTP